MKNIKEILKKHGVEVEDFDAFEKDVLENYKTVSEVDKLNKKIDSLQEENKTLTSKHAEDLKAKDDSLEKLQKELEDSGVDKEALDKVNEELTKVREDFEKAKTQYEKDIASQKYEYAVKGLVNNLKFTSNSAKELFMQKVMAEDAGLSLKDGKVLGFDDFVDVYKKNDADAFVQEKEEGEGDEADGSKSAEPKPQFGGKTQKLDDAKASDSKEGKTTKTIIW